MIAAIPALQYPSGNDMTGLIPVAILASVFVACWEIFGTAFGDVLPVAQPILITDGGEVSASVIEPARSEDVSES